MTPITLESIKEQQTKLSQLISSFEVQQTFQKMFPIEVAMPDLRAGEKWVATVIANDGKTKYHLSILEGDNDGAEWASQMEWAKNQGGDLPDLVEYAIFKKYMPERFQKAAYWSNTTHANDSGYAWCQYFNDGRQISNTKGAALRAVAIRRSFI